MPSKNQFHSTLVLTASNSLVKISFNRTLHSLKRPPAFASGRFVISRSSPTAAAAAHPHNTVCLYTSSHCPNKKKTSLGCPWGERPLVELYLEPGDFSERCTEKLPLRVDFIHRLEFGEVSGHRVLIKRGPGNRGPMECGTTHEATSGMSS